MAAVVVLRHAVRLYLPAGAALRHGRRSSALRRAGRAYHHLTRPFSTASGSPACTYWCALAERLRGGGVDGALRRRDPFPVFLFLANIRSDAGYWLPAAAGRAGAIRRRAAHDRFSPDPRAWRWRRPGSVCARGARCAGAAAALCALVVSNNFYGGHGAGHVLSDPGVGRLAHRVGTTALWLRAAAIAALAYGLTAFWLIPSYLRVTCSKT